MSNKYAQSDSLIMLPFNKKTYLSSFYGLVPGGVTPEVNPLIPVKIPAKAHRTPSVVCGSLTAYLVPLGEPLVSNLVWNTKDMTPTLAYLVTCGFLTA
jgi:hypothetical protein